MEDVKNYYRGQSLKTAYSILGSLGILGNPSQIIREFSGGIDNLLDSHGDNSVQVIAEGAGVIAKNTFSGIFGGINSTTGSVAGVISLMSADKNFMKERGLRRRKKAKNVLQGFEQGARSLFQGITSGVSGVVMQPVREVQQSGAKGIFTGVIKGISGLITKPVAGIFDTVSKTAEGIQNTAKGNVDSVRRARPPRPFYNEDMAVKPYSYDDAIYYQSLKFQKNREDYLVTSYSCLSRSNLIVYLAITTKFIILIDEQGKSIQFELSKVTNIYVPSSNCLTFEYQASGGTNRMTFEVNDNRNDANTISEDILYQISTLLTKSSPK